jgi:hypothetical protein
MLAACACKNSRQLGPLRRGAGSSFRFGQQPADAGRRHSEAELGELAADPPMTPARILACEPQYQLPNLGRQARPSASAHRLSPLPADERLMPAQQRPRSHQEHAS